MEKGKILVVDDEQSIRFTFRSFLEDEGYEAATAVDYEEALEALSETVFDLIYIDIILEGKSGIDLLRRVKEDSPSTEVIIVTGAPTVDSASEALRLGALDYIVKPVRQDTLLRAAELALQHKALLESKEALRLNLEAIFRSVKDAIVTVDDELRVVETNQAAEKLCGFRRSEALGKPLQDSVKSCRAGCRVALEETVSRGDPVELRYIECGAAHNPGQIVSVTATPLMKSEDSPSGGVMVVRDETRLIELERTLGRQKPGRIVGKSRAIRNLLSTIQALGDVQTSVLITGESGTGKELVADALHAAGHRCDKPLVKVNCSALSEDLLESELFGHIRGAFTGAIQDKVGRFQRADGGTIFLDEIGEITPRMQLRFLRVLETMEFERVGESVPVRVDVRVIAATNRDLKQRVARGQFREDLYYRLKVFEITLPPLRERRDDIPLLVCHFLERFNLRFDKNVKSVSDSVMKLFALYGWPGNVRELENAMEHAFILCRSDTLTLRDLPPELIRGGGSAFLPDSSAEDAEVHAIMDALRRASFNKSKAAGLLGISRRTLYRKIQRLGIAV